MGDSELLCAGVAAAPLHPGGGPDPGHGRGDALRLLRRFASVCYAVGHAVLGLLLLSCNEHFLTDTAVLATGPAQERILCESLGKHALHTMARLADVDDTRASLGWARVPLGHLFSERLLEWLRLGACQQAYCRMRAARRDESTLLRLYCDVLWQAMQVTVVQCPARDNPMCTTIAAPVLAAVMRCVDEPAPAPPPLCAGELACGSSVDALRNTNNKRNWGL